MSKIINKLLQRILIRRKRQGIIDMFNKIDTFIPENTERVRLDSTKHNKNGVSLAVVGENVNL